MNRLHRDILGWRRSGQQSYYPRLARTRQRHFPITRFAADELPDANLPDANRRGCPRRSPDASVGTAGGRVSAAATSCLASPPIASAARRDRCWPCVSRRSGVPGIHKRHACEREIRHVSGNDGHAVNKRGRRDQPVANWLRIGHMEKRTAAGRGRINGQDASGKGGHHMIVQPGAENFPRGRVTALGEQRADLELLDNDHREEQASGWDRPGPRCHIVIGPGRACLPQLGNHVRVQQIHQVRPSGG